MVFMRMYNARRFKYRGTCIFPTSEMLLDLPLERIRIYMPIFAYLAQ